MSDVRTFHFLQGSLTCRFVRRAIQLLLHFKVINCGLTLWPITTLLVSKHPTFIISGQYILDYYSLFLWGNYIISVCLMTSVPAEELDFSFG